MPNTSNGVAAGLVRTFNDSLDDPWGEVSTGYYDTAVYVHAAAVCPAAIPEHVARTALGQLLRTQSADGSWGPPLPPLQYRLVPTLAAATALLGWTAHTSEAIPNVLRALEFLACNAERFSPRALPDTVAVEYLVPAWLDELLRALAGHDHVAPPAGLLAGLHRLQELHASGFAALGHLRAAVRSGHVFPAQLAFTLEVLDSRARLAAGIFTEGHVACSPSATAIMATEVPHVSSRTRWYLWETARRRVPHFAPMATFERSWLVANAVRAGHRPTGAVVARMADYFTTTLDAGAVPMGPGLPPDGDITSAMVFAHAQIGGSPNPACLRHFETPGGFVNYHAERTPSVSTNAHMLEALGCTSAPDLPWIADAQRRVEDFLLAGQQADGSWTDKWHASPHYATSCATTALAHWGGLSSHDAVNRATRWTLATQHHDGSWGRWGPTVDETAHAVLQLIATNAEDPAAQGAIRRGLDFLTETRHAAPDDTVHTPLWHSKELYAPSRIITGLVAAVTRSPALAHHLVSD